MKINAVSKEDLMVILARKLEEIENGLNLRCINIRCHPSDGFLRRRRTHGDTYLRRKIYNVEIRERAVGSE
jgi:hypothetical protein